MPRCSEWSGINRYLIKDLEFRLNTSDLFEWIESQAGLLFNEGRVGDGHIEFTEPIRKCRKIRRICAEEIIGTACIRPVEGEAYDIFHFPGLPIHKLRFAIAHELGHTYWFAPGGGAKPLSPLQWKLGRDPSIEYLCNRFAAAFLLPREPVVDFVNSIGRGLSCPLNVIPAASKKYRVADRAVARRVFFELSATNVAVVCLKTAESGDPDVSSSWVTQWCVLPNEYYQPIKTKGFSVPLHSTNRKIPNEMIPTLCTDQAQEVELDGRWWDLLEMQPLSKARIPFRRLPSKEAKTGYAFKDGPLLYLALPLFQET